MIVDCAAYENGLRCGEDLALSEAVEAARNDGTFAWLGVYEPTAEEFESIAASRPARAGGGGRGQCAPAPQGRALRRHPVRRREDGQLRRL
jgi:hypothetical protein